MTDYDHPDWKEFLEEGKNEYEQAVYDDNPVIREIRGVQFVSHSKGRNRARKRPAYIELLSYSGSPRRFRTSRRFPFDTVATELYNVGATELDPRDVDKHLRTAISDGFQRGFIRPRW